MKVGTLMITLLDSLRIGLWAVLSANPPSSVGLGANDQNLLQRAPFHNAFIDLALRIRAGSSSCDQRSRIASPDHPIRLNSSSAAGSENPESEELSANLDMGILWPKHFQGRRRVRIDHQRNAPLPSHQLPQCHRGLGLGLV